MSILSEKFLLWNEYYTLHQKSHSLDDIDIELQFLLIELYKNIIKQLNDIIDITQILGMFDENVDPHLLLYLWNFIFKPCKNKIDYLDYDKMIRKVIFIYDSNLEEKQILYIVEILIPFVVEIKKLYKIHFKNEKIMINITPQKKITKFIRPLDKRDNSGNYNKIHVYPINYSFEFSKFIPKQYFF